MNTLFINKDKALIKYINTYLIIPRDKINDKSYIINCWSTGAYCIPEDTVDLLVGKYIKQIFK